MVSSSTIIFSIFILIFIFRTYYLPDIFKSMNGVSTFIASSNFLPFFNFSKTLNEFLNTDEAGDHKLQGRVSPSASIFDKLLKIEKVSSAPLQMS